MKDPVRIDVSTAPLQEQVYLARSDVHRMTPLHESS